MQDLDKTVRALYLLKYNDFGQPDHLEISLGYLGKKKTLYGLKPCFFKFSDNFSTYLSEPEKHLLEDENLRMQLGSDALMHFFKDFELNGYNFKGHVISLTEKEIEVEESNKIEVLPNTSLSAKIPYCLYTKNMINGVGIAVYDNTVKSGTLAHFNLETNTFDSCKQLLESELENSFNKLSISIAMVNSPKSTHIQRLEFDSTKDFCTNFILKNRDCFEKYSVCLAPPEDPIIRYLAVDTWNHNFLIL